jgi:non-ribosomal peptide synthetase component F
LVRVTALEPVSGAALVDVADTAAPVEFPYPDARSVAYLIYTSGTTGTPKGVAVTHANVVGMLAGVRARIELTAAHGGQHVWTLFHSLAFDFSVWEMWGALLHGGRLVVVPDETVRSPREFHDLLVSERVTVLSQTPSAFDAFAAAAAGALPSLEVVVFGGEALDPRRMEAWPAEPRLINMYGITEGTVHASFRELTAADATGGVSPIGDPLPSAEFFVLDERLGIVPVGVVGELYLGGLGVAQGY